MGVQQSVGVGGYLDEIKKINFPAHLFPKKTKNFTTGKNLRIDCPAIPGVYASEYILTEDMELINVSIACSGYHDDDEWEAIFIHPDADAETFIEAMPIRELPESMNMGNVLYTVRALEAGTKVRIEFHNISGTSKKVWPALRFLR